VADIIQIPCAGSTAEAYLSRPDDQPRPGVLFFMDAIGLRPQIAAMTDRIASWGYVVLAPNFFYRNGSIADLAPRTDLTTPEGRAAFFASGLMERVAALTPELSDADTEVWVAELGRRAGRPIGTTGYCMGARLAVRAAAAHPDLVAAVGGFHGGGLVTDKPDSPHLVLSAARAEFVFGHADNDQSMPAEAVAAWGVALTGAGLVHRNEVYAGAVHGYTMADTSAYDEDSAERHFTVLRELFERALAAGDQS
jgi:carboxymethylenebutenolidase